MKQFSLDEFKKNQNRKVVTRSGRSVRVLCTDAKGDRPVFGLALGVDNCEFPIMCSAIGETEFEEDDLFFDSVKKEGYINLFRRGDKVEVGFVLGTKEEAMSILGRKPRKDYITTIHIEWEE